MSAEPEQQDLNFFDYLTVLIKWRKWLVINFLVVCSLTTIMVFIVPKWYKATATVLPPKRDTGLLGGGLSGLLNNVPAVGDLSFLGLDLFPQSETAMSYVAILKSRTVADLIIDRFDLINVYREKDRERTRKQLYENIDIEIEKEGTISVTVLDTDPRRVAAMANAFVYYLDSLNVELNVQKARNNRIFLEKRFNQNKQELTRAEEALKGYQEQHGILELSTQLEAAISETAELTATAMMQEILLQVKESALSPTHSEVRRSRRELDALRKKLNEIQFGNGRVISNPDSIVNTDTFFLPLVQMPQVGLVYVRLRREVEVQTLLYWFLMQQYEQVQIQEARDVPTVQVLDEGIIPIRKARPYRLLTIGVAGIMSLIFTCLYIFSREYLERIETTGGQRAEQLQWIKQQIRGELHRWSPRK